MRIDQKEKLAERLRQAIKADALSNKEIEQIVDSSQLFIGIRARIEAEKSAALAIGKNTKLNWLVIILGNRISAWKQPMRPAFVSAVALLLISLVLNWFLYKPLFSEREKSETAQSQTAPSGKPNIDKTAVLPINENRVSGGLQTEKSSQSVSVIIKKRQVPNGELKNIRKIKFVETAQQSKRNLANRRPQTAQPRDFYQLAFAADLEAGENKQIVRVKLSSTALAQLGVVAPVSTNSNNSVTADLLLGENGVPRAIRFVK